MTFPSPSVRKKISGVKDEAFIDSENLAEIAAFGEISFSPSAGLTASTKGVSVSGSGYVVKDHE